MESAVIGFVPFVIRNPAPLSRELAVRVFSVV